MGFLQVACRLDKIVGLRAPGVICKSKTLALRCWVTVGILDTPDEGVFTVHEKPEAAFDLDKYQHILMYLLLSVTYHGGCKGQPPNLVPIVVELFGGLAKVVWKYSQNEEGVECSMIWLNHIISAVDNNHEFHLQLSLDVYRQSTAVPENPKQMWHDSSHDRTLWDQN